MPTTFVCADEPQIALFDDDVVVIPGLCREPGRVSEFVDGIDRAVLVLHPDKYDVASVQRALRSIDVDPLGVQIMDVRGEVDPCVLGASVAGLQARAKAFRASKPEQAKPVFPDAVTRRGFLRPPAPIYTAAPAITQNTCAAGNGCRACVDVCPRGAYRWNAGRISYDKDLCMPCGQCVTACPTGSIENASLTPSMLEAQVKSVIEESLDPVGLRFVCSRGSVKTRTAWIDISVPCTSMVPATWLIACLLLGSGGVYAVPCSDSGCDLGLDGGAVSSNRLARALLEEVGFDANRVDGVTVDTPLPGVHMDGMFDGRRAAKVFAALTEVAERPILVDRASSPLGVVEIDVDVCTLCGQCAKSCPTSALVETYEGDTVSLSFNAALCVNCGQCALSCPEVERGAIAVVGRVDSRLITSDPIELNAGDVAMCELCGSAIAPASMMERIGSLLGHEFEATVGVLANRCLDCRGRL